MQPEPKIATPKSKAIKRDRPSPPEIEESELNCEPAEKPQAVTKSRRIESENKSTEPANAVEVNAAVDTGPEYKDDMDFSILEDDENQFEAVPVAVPVAKVEPNVKVNKQKIKQETKSFESILSNWESICNNDDDDELLSSVTVEETISQSTESKDMKFWFWDAWEDPIKFPGKVFLFGKEPLENNPKEFRSVCVTIENVQRCLYALPHEFVSV